MAFTRPALSDPGLRDNIRPVNLTSRGRTSAHLFPIFRIKTPATGYWPMPVCVDRPDRALSEKKSFCTPEPYNHSFSLSRELSEIF